jgi:RNA recognition motif-containing protein
MLKETFGSFGEVAEANVISDRATGRSKGFGFVEMPNADEAQAAMSSLNGSDLMGCTMKVNEAKPRNDRW